MKIFVALSALLLQLCATRVAAGELFYEFNPQLLANTKAWNNSASLLTNDGYIAPAVPLGMELTAVSPPDDRYAQSCTYPSPSDSKSPAKVYVVVSNCLADKKSVIETWVEKVKNQKNRYFQGDEVYTLVYLYKYINACPGQTFQGAEPFDDAASLPSDVVGVIGFVAESASATTLTKYTDIRNTPLIGFQQKEMLPELQVGFNFYSDAKSLDVYNPYTIVRTLHCKGLKNGVPTSYVDANGVRKCFCSCPADYKLSGSECTKEEDPIDENCQCVWQRGDPVYTFNVVEGEEAKYKNNLGTCSIENLALRNNVGLLPVPVVFDNYVDHNRINLGESGLPGTVSGPHIALMTKPVGVMVTTGSASVKDNDDATTDYYTWKDYQTNKVAKIDAIEFTRTSRYTVQLKAYDYHLGTKHAECSACVLVLDKRRPTVNPSFACPTAVDLAASELTETNLRRAQAAVNGITSVKTNALNDPCGRNTRCDEDTLKTKAFVDSDYGSPVSSLNGLSTYFDTSAVRSDLLTRLTGNGPDDEQCTRCALVKTVLKEYWTPYTCTSTSATAVCDGTASCEITQCVTVNGQNVADATATLKDNIKADSKNVVTKINNDGSTSDSALWAKYSLDTNVHVALKCTAFPSKTPPALLADDQNVLTTAEECTYTTKLADLITTTQGPKVTAPATDPLFTEGDVGNFVKWRYKVNGGAWKDWSATAEETFDESSTDVTVEAWTKCGSVKQFTFKVVLHLNNEIKVCDYFPDMWYQSTTAPLTSVTNTFCLHSKSDFAEVTFDYHPNIGLDYNVEKFQMSISQVKCKLKYEGKDFTDILDSDSFTGSPKSFQIVKQFAIDAIDLPTTKAETSFSVECDFTYSRLPDASLTTQRCSQTFTITDCTRPLISKPCLLDDKCDFSKCAKAGSGGQDLFQACGANRVTQGSDGNTAFLEAETTCCESCDTQFYTTACRPIEPFPATETQKFGTLKRCEAVAVPPPVAVMMASSAADSMMQQQSLAASGTTALAGASALVAIVALVAVHRRRRAAANKINLEDDAYYPLMS